MQTEIHAAVSGSCVRRKSVPCIQEDRSSRQEKATNEGEMVQYHQQSLIPSPVCFLRI